MAAKRLFIAGLIVMCFFACGHLTGFLLAARAARHDPNMADVTRTMRDYKAKLFGFEPSLLDFREYFSLNFSILMSLAALLGFAAMSLASDQSEAIRLLSMIYGLVMLLLFGTSLYFSIFQGIVTCLVIAVLFGLSWWFA